MEHHLTTYIRTKLVFQHRLKRLNNYDTVRIYKYELKKLGCDKGPLLYALKSRGEILYDKDGNFTVCHKDGPIRPEMLDITKKQPKLSLPLTPLHKWMRRQLMYVDINCEKKDLPVYFKTFLEHRKEVLPSFFRVDAFSHRVHTPVVNLKSDLRLKLTFYGGKIASLDVKQMQPTILAKVLDDAVGSNPFSDAIWNGDDVYVMLLKYNSAIKDRTQAKRELLKLLFHPQTDDKIASMFKGDSKWIQWISKYKSEEEPRNPHRNKKHTNLAWLLQYSEVQVMSEIWKKLMEKGVPFLSIHDDVLCRLEDRQVVYNVMNSVLKKHFKRYSINIDHSEKNGDVP